MNKNWILLGLAGLVLAFFLLLPNKQPLPDTALIVGTNAEFAPFTFIEKGHIVGFDIDVATNVCKRLGKEMKIKDMPFDALISEVTLGNEHFVAAGMSITEERAKRVLFTKPYIQDEPLVIVTKEAVSSLEELKGKTVVVNEGFTADLYMSHKPGYTLIRLPAISDGFLALQSGRADAFITAKNTVGQFLERQNEAHLCICQLPDTNESCALLISKKYPELLPQIQGALDAMIEDGTMAHLKTKWKLL